MSETNLSEYEKDLLGRIRDTEGQIKALENEKAVLLKMLAKAKNSNVPLGARKNSFSRIAIEKRVIDAITRRSNQVATLDHLYVDAKHLDSDLKRGTFRTYIHRMKNKGIIESAGHAWWRLKK